MLPTEELNDHSFLAEELLIPGVNHSDGGRVNMFISHQGQLLVPNKAETPKVFTRFENQVGKYSTGYIAPKENETIKINQILSFNENHKLLLITRTKLDNNQNIINESEDIIDLNKAVNLTEYYGYLNNFSKELKEGATFTNNNYGKEWICHNGMYDDELNLQYGHNLKAVYLPFKGLTYEDGLVISESAAKRFSHTDVQVYDVVLNQNDVLVNLLGDETEYKSVPNINEEVENGVLCSRRRINYSNILAEFKEFAFNQTTADDTIFYADGIVMDIVAYSNLDEESLNTPYNKFIKEILDTQSKVYNSLIKYVDKSKKAKKVVSDTLLFWYQKAKDYLNTEIKYNFDKREFEGIVLKITVAHHAELVVGAKLTGRLF